MITPFVMLFIDGVSLFVYKYPIWNDVYAYLSQVTGHTLLSLFFMWYFALRMRFCVYAKISLLGLTLLNLFNIAYHALNLGNYILYAQIIVLTSLSLATVYLIKNK